MPEYKCKCCKKPFTARAADRKRGWALYCSKSCKAKKQEARTGQYAAHQNRLRKHPFVDNETYDHYQREHGGTPQFSRSGHYEGFVMSPEDLSYGGYGDADIDTPFGDGKF
jgi:hypothetical protein